MPETLREQLLTNGYCIVPRVLPADLLAGLRRVTDGMLEAQSQEDRAKHRSTGSLMGVMSDPIFADLIALPSALGALREMGFPEPKYSSGYVISKPPGSPRLFWHYDWAGWDDPGAFGPVPQQVFLMYYLVDTTRQNGCLRVVPGSHLHDNALHGELSEAHTPKLDEAADLSLPEFSTRPDEVDVTVKAGDLVIGDSRILHAAHANESDFRRTVITLWFHPDMSNLAPATQAFIAKMSWLAPVDWPTEKRALVEPLRAIYTGPAQPVPWNRKRPMRSAHTV